MRSSRSSRNNDTGLFGGAGWLFADLMLAVVAPDDQPGEVRVMVGLPAMRIECDPDEVFATLL